MALKRVEGVPGAPWQMELNGRLESITIESELLTNNPLGDPNRRPLYVYIPPGHDDSSDLKYPTVYLIQGFTGQVDMWFNRSPFEPNMIERVDDLFSRSDTPPALVVFVDAWTSYGGSQFINSVATGPYMDYLCDEVVPFIEAEFPAVPDRHHRGITGKSSGGYGSMVVPMLRPDTFCALATHAGDALFEVCYMSDFRSTVRILRDHFEGSYDVFFERLRAERFEFGRFGEVLDTYAMAACYSPDESNPGKALLPFDLETGQLIPEVWERWLEWDPVRMAPKRLDALTQMKRIYIDAGRKDEYYLDLGAHAFSRELTKGGIDHTLELFDGTHGGLQYRYPDAIRELVMAMTPWRG
jgi:S-formylglutathione hydrolase FrmB